MTATFSEDDRGKTVVAGTERIGTVTDVQAGMAYVDVDLNHVSEALEDALGWADDDERYTLDEDDVTAVTNSQVRLRDDRFRDA